MWRGVSIVLASTLGACAPLPGDAVSDLPAGSVTRPQPSPTVYSAAEAAAFLREIDPLNGDWHALEIDGRPLPSGRRALLQGHEGAFLSTSGDCTSSSTSYIREGSRLDVTRHIPPEVRKCEDAIAGALDAALAQAVARTRSWSIDAAGRLRLAGAEGAGALFARPVPRRPELHGRWLVESIAGKSFSGRIDFGDDVVGAQAGCNAFGGRAAIGPGTLQLRDGAQTLIGCGKEREAADATLFGALQEARSWRISSDGRLLIDGGAAIVARRPAPASFSLAGRYHVCNNSTLPDISHDGEVWVEFAGETVRDQAGCVASYDTAGAALRLGLGDAPACRISALPRRGAAEIGGSRSPLAQFRPDGFAWDDEGRLRLRTPRGVLAMCKATPAERG